MCLTCGLATPGVAELAANRMLLLELRRFVRPAAPEGAPRVESLLLTAGAAKEPEPRATILATEPQWYTTKEPY